MTKYNMEFKQHLLNEQKKYFSDKVGDVLTGIHDLIEGGKQINLRKLMEYSLDIVNKIRKILHSAWTGAELKYLHVLQKCGVAIMKAIDQKGDIHEILESCSAEIKNILKKLGNPVNTVDS